MKEYEFEAHIQDVEECAGYEILECLNDFMHNRVGSKLLRTCIHDWVFVIHDWHTSY